MLGASVPACSTPWARRAKAIYGKPFLTGSRSGCGGSATGTVAVAVSVAGGLARKFFGISVFCVRSERLCCL